MGVGSDCKRFYKVVWSANTDHNIGNGECTIGTLACVASLDDKLLIFLARENGLKTCRADWRTNLVVGEHAWLDEEAFSLKVVINLLDLRSIWNRLWNYDEVEHGIFDHVSEDRVAGFLELVKDCVVGIGSDVEAKVAVLAELVLLILCFGRNFVEVRVT